MEEHVEIQESNVVQSAYEIDLRHHRAYRLVYFVMAVIEALLIFRFFLKLLGANPSNAFAEIIYALTTVLLLPFNGLFPRAVAPVADSAAPVVVNRIFEPATLIAMLVYMLLGWGIARLILIIRSKPAHDR